MSFEDFEQFLGGHLLLENFAASSVKRCFCVVGKGLRLAALVYFVLNVDEHGCAEAGFNVPLLYLAERAGIGTDLGEGPIRIASRGRCAVPWHSLNLWDANNDGFVAEVQQRVYRNRLNLKSVTEYGVVFEPEAVGEIESIDEYDTLASGQTSIANGGESADLHQAFAERLDEVFGTAGKLTMQDMIRLHSEQLAQAKLKYRSEIEAQQRTYLAQLKEVRDANRELKVALRQEQSRNRRLQQMLRE